MLLKKMFLGLSLVCASMMYAVTWNPAFNLDVSTFTPSSNALDGNNAIAVYLQFVGGNMVLFSKVSLDGGTTWSPSLRISDPLYYVANLYDVIKLHGKNALVVFPITSSTYQVIQAAYSEDCGQTWSIPQNISNPSDGAAESPETAFDGQVAVSVWKKFISGNGFVQAAWSNNSGKNWSSPVALSGFGILGDYPGIAVQGNRAIAIWALNDIVQVSYSDDGQSWSSPMDLSSTSATYPKIAMSGNDVIAIWKRMVGVDDYVIEERISSNGGTTWSDIKTISPHEVNIVQWPAITFFGNRAIVCWSASLGVRSVWSNDKGSTWSSPTDLSAPGEIIGDQLSLCADENNAAVFWFSLIEAKGVIRSASSTDYGMHWDGPVTISPTAATWSSYPDSALSGSKVFALWTSSVSSDYVYGAIGNFPVTSLTYAKKEASMLFEKRLANQITWDGVTQAVAYRIYTDAALTQKIYDGKTRVFYDYNPQPNKAYYVVWIDSFGNQSPAQMIQIP